MSPSTRAIPLYVLLVMTAAVSLLIAVAGLFPAEPFAAPNARWIVTYSLVFVLSAIGAVRVRARLRRANPTGTRVMNATLMMLGVLIVAGVEVVGRVRMPPWPARDLHGASPTLGSNAWGRIQSLRPDAQGNNRWGQRDRERADKPAPGMTRVAFVGDSFLEEASITPLPLLVERALSGERVEIVNLGVSVTAPDDYYHVVRKVAIPLGARHLFVFVFMGNDVMTPPDHGVFPPRPSAVDLDRPPLKTILPGTTFWLDTLRRRPSPWSGGLHAQEQAALASFQAKGPSGMVDELMRYYRGNAPKLARRMLEQRDLSELHEHFTHPDLGLFRTFALYKALVTLTGELPDRARDVPALERDVGYTMRWIRAIAARAEAAQIGVEFVIIPHPFDVDERIQEHWAPLVDARAMTEYVRRSAEILRRELTRSNLRFVDLYPVLTGTRGTYLNMDMHWSPLGNEMVAPVIAAAVKRALAGSGT